MPILQILDTSDSDFEMDTDEETDTDSIPTLMAMRRDVFTTMIIDTPTEKCCSVK
jgi:hypothetical protein